MEKISLVQKMRRPFRYSNWNAAFMIAGLNVIVFILCRMIPNLIYYLALNPYNVVYAKAYWQLFTYFFVHDTSGWQHIFFNMLGLILFGSTVERAIGSKEFLLMYLLSGLFCGIVSFIVYVLSGAWNVFLYGASGALYAIMLMYAVVFPRAKIFIWGILPIPAPLLIAVYAGIEIASQLLSLKSGVAHMTHLAGFLFAWIYCLVRIGINPWKVWKNAYRR